MTQQFLISKILETTFTSPPIFGRHLPLLVWGSIESREYTAMYL